MTWDRRFRLQARVPVHSFQKVCPDGSWVFGTVNDALSNTGGFPEAYKADGNEFHPTVIVRSCAQVSRSIIDPSKPSRFGTSDQLCTQGLEHRTAMPARAPAPQFSCLGISLYLAAAN